MTDPAVPKLRVPAFRAAVVALGTAGVAALLVVVAGASIPDAARALWDGAFGNATSLGESLARSTSLVLCGVAAVVAFRSGVLNIGLEGQLLVGASAAAAVGPALGEVPALALPALLASSALAGALFVLPAAWLSEKRGIPPVLSTILLNLLGASLVTWLVRGPLRDPLGEYPQSRALSDAVRLAPLWPGSRATAAAPLALLLAAVAAFLLFRSRLGLKLRAVGLSPAAARAAGLPDTRLRVLAFTLSGALAGLAGGLEVAALTGRLYDPFSSGVGYTGIAVALLGGTNPLGAALVGLLFAALGSGAGALQRDAGVPASLALAVPALAVLALLLARGGEPETAE